VVAAALIRDVALAPLASVPKTSEDKTHFFFKSFCKYLKLVELSENVLSGYKMLSKARGSSGAGELVRAPLYAARWMCTTQLKGAALP
jgi:hypothetical protein